MGGELTTAGGQVAADHLARWDGQAWSAVGSVQYVDQPYSTAVSALGCDETHLYVGGVFDHVGEVAASSLARLELATGRWEAVRPGVRYLGSPGQVHALLLAGGRLWVGGAFDTAGPHSTYSLASLDTATGEWTSYGTGILNGDLAGIVDALAVDSATGAVYVGGSFTAADTVTASGVVRVDGTTLTSTGRFTRFGDPSTASVKALAVAGSRVYAGGEFTTAGNAATTSWAAYDGTRWSVPAPLDNTVRALAAVGTGVVVLGDFAFSGQLRVTHGGMWTADGWRLFGEGLSYDPYAGGTVFALSAGDDGVYAGGYFDQAGRRPVGSVARWTDDGWDAVAGGVRGVDALGKVYALARLGGDVFAAGSFVTAGPGTAANVARWDGTAWQPLGSGLNGTAYALTVLGGKLSAGGQFTNAGMVGASAVAAWDPETQTWSPVGLPHDRRRRGVGRTRPGARPAGGGQRPLRRRDLRHRRRAGVDEGPGPRLRRSAPGGVAVRHAGRALDDPGWRGPARAGPRQPRRRAGGRRRLLPGGGPLAAGGVAGLDPATGTWSTYGSGIGGGLSGVTHVEAVALEADGTLWVGGTFDTAGGVASCSIARYARTAGQG